MKKILLFMLAAIALSACKSEQQKMCEEYLRQNLKCPSTLKVCEYTEQYVENRVSVDTTYHVRKVYGKMGWSSWKSISSIKVDSLRETTITYPSHWDCNVTYDAQNLMGATVRESINLIIPIGYSYAMTWQNWFDFRYNLREVKTWHESHTYTDIPEKSYRVMYDGKWASLYELKK